MFRFFKGKWISQEEYERKVDCIKSLADCNRSLEKNEEEDPWEREVEELSGTLTRSKREEEPWKQEYSYEYGRTIEIPKTKKEGEEWQVSCIEELLRLNKRLGEYTPSNPELAELTIQEIVCKLSIEMQRQNQVLMTALRHLMGKNDG